MYHIIYSCVPCGCERQYGATNGLLNNRHNPIVFADAFIHCAACSEAKGKPTATHHRFVAAELVDGRHQRSLEKIGTVSSR